MKAQRLLLVSGDNLKNQLVESHLAVEVSFCWAESNEEALRQLKTVEFDLLLVEHSPPIVDGLALCRHISTAGLACPTLLILNEADQHLIVPALKVGVRAYLVKDQRESYYSSLPDLIDYAVRPPSSSPETEGACRLQTGHFDLLKQLSNQLGAVREPSQVLDLVTAQVQEAFGYEHVAIFLIEDSTINLKAIASVFEAGLAKHYQRQQPQSAISVTAASGEIWLVNDIRPESIYTFWPQGAEALTKAELCIPIKLGDQTLGMMNIQSSKAEAFDERSVSTIETLTHIVAMALENARLYGRSSRDEDERRQAEIALEKAYQRVTLYIENSPLFVVEWDHQARVTYWSHEAEIFFGWQSEEVCGRGLLDRELVHEYDLATALHHMQQLCTGQQRGNLGLYRNLTKDGKIVYCEWYNSVVTDANGQVVSIISLVLDVTERHQAIMELAESELRFRQVVSSISDHIYIGEITADGQTRYTSPNVEALTGFPPEKFGDWGFWQTLIHPEDRPVAENQRWDTNQNSEVEYRMRRADGKLIWVRDSRRIEVEKDPQEHVKGRFVYGVVSDITERKLAEMALVKERMLLAKRVEERTSELSAANAALARAARLKDEFLANMSHELRTPLNAILGKSETLQEGVYGLLNTDQTRSLRMIEESGRHLLALINDILDVSKIEAGKLELDIRPVSVTWICETSLRLVKEMANRKNLSVYSTLDQSVTAIPADARRLKQILVNLLSNAVKFTPEGGSIGLEVKGDLEKDVVRFTVWDTGIGIPKVDIERLFEPFVQLDSSLSRQFVGTGLGLSLVYRMTELHGGGISLHSEENKGSRFTVSFPWGKETAADESNDQPLDDEKIDPVTVTWYAPGTDRLQTVTDQIHSSSQLILIVEDNEANIDTLSEYLPYKGFQIVVARNGNEAIDRARETKPDLILMDIQTPGMDGITATRYIRQDSTLAGIPIIALTALAMPGDRERCLEAGVDEYLSKPVSLKQLLITIKEYLNLKVKTETK